MHVSLASHSTTNPFFGSSGFVQSKKYKSNYVQTKEHVICVNLYWLRRWGCYKICEIKYAVDRLLLRHHFQMVTNKSKNEKKKLKQRILIQGTVAACVVEFGQIFKRPPKWVQTNLCHSGKTIQQRNHKKHKLMIWT